MRFLLLFLLSFFFQILAHAQDKPLLFEQFSEWANKNFERNEGVESNNEIYSKIIGITEEKEECSLHVTFKKSGLGFYLALCLGRANQNICVGGHINEYIEAGKLELTGSQIIFKQLKQDSDSGIVADLVPNFETTLTIELSRLQLPFSASAPYANGRTVVCNLRADGI